MKIKSVNKKTGTIVIGYDKPYKDDKGCAIIAKKNADETFTIGDVYELDEPRDDETIEQWIERNWST